MIGSLPKLIALLMVLLLIGSTFVGAIIYFIKWKKKRKHNLKNWLKNGYNEELLDTYMSEVLDNDKKFDEDLVIE